MKKLLKGALTLAIATIVGIPQLQAAGDANYSIQVKSLNYDRQYNNTNRKGVYYINNDPRYTNKYWLKVEGYHPYTTTFTANYYDPYNRTTTNNKTCYVKQFGVSKGVVYWIDPTKNVINYWNTVDGTAGTFAPTGTYNGVSYSFKGSDTGYGSITNDWYGNLVHVWNGYGGGSNNINTSARGFAVYKAPDTYGTRITTAPVLSDMPTCTTLHGRRTAAGLAWNNSNVTNPNYLATENVHSGSSTMTNLNTYGINGGNQLAGEKIAVDYLSASGNLFDNVGWVDNSTYQAGYWGGQVWLTYGHIVTGNMFADGAYSNWYINYLITTSPGTAQIANGSYGNGLLNYSREFFFQEVGGADLGENWNQYYYTSPNRGFYQTSQDSKISHIPTEVNVVGSYYYGSDKTTAPDVQILKGYRVIANNLYKDFTDAHRNGSFDVTADNTNIGLAFAYNLTSNPSPINSSINAWLEYEKVNENVLALYSYCPGQGFSKFFVTAVRNNNAISGVSVTQHNSINNLTPQAKITWTQQPYDRETLHRYLIYYKAYNTTTGEVIGESGVTVDNATWKLATVDANGNPKPVDIGLSTTGTFYHNTPIGIDANGKKYQITYKYLIVPVYDGSDHMGQEYETGTITPTLPRAIVKGNLYQVTDNGGPNGETRYGFSVRLDPYFDANAVGATSATRFVITSAGGVPGWNALKEATSVTLADGTPLTFVENASFTEIGGNLPTVVNQYTLDIPVTVGADGKLPSIIWHNVDPNKTFQVGLHVEYTPYADFIAQNPDPATLTIPTMTLNMTEANIYPIYGEYDTWQGDLYPLGAQRKVGSNEVTNPVAMKLANTLGTKGSAINPLLVTDEVMENWNIEYEYNVYKNDSRVVAFEFDASNSQGGATYYSNFNKVMFDIAGLPIKKTAWTTHDVLDLSDAQRATNDNITKQGYDVATGDDIYSTRVDVTFTRKETSVVTSSDIAVTKDGVAANIDMSNVKTNPFPSLEVDFGKTLALLKRESTHFYYNSSDDNGYYPYYYDAVAQWEWDNHKNTGNLNRYVGFHAVPVMDCVGHYVKDESGKLSNTWIPYYAPSVLNNYYVEQNNITLTKDGRDGYLKGIGYDGTSATDWSALASDAGTLPMEIHYVWGGDKLLSNDEDLSIMTFPIMMTADYPVIESRNGAILLHNSDNNDLYYTLESDCKNGSAVMSLISSSDKDRIYADYVTNTTGVEGILTNAAGGVNLYPNPVGSTFTLQAPMAMDNVAIFTMDGQLVKVVKDINDTTVSINVDELPQGVYIVNTLGIAKMMIKK